MRNKINNITGEELLLSTDELGNSTLIPLKLLKEYLTPKEKTKPPVKKKPEKSKATKEQ